MLTICTFQIGTESSYEVSMNSKQQLLLRNSPDKNRAILYHVQHDQGLQLVQKSLNRNMLTICTFPIGTESSYEVSLNSKQNLLRNSPDKNCSILYHVQHDQGLQLVQKSLNRNMLTICTSPICTKSSCEVWLNSKQRLLRNRPDKNYSIFPANMSISAACRNIAVGIPTSDRRRSDIDNYTDIGPTSAACRQIAYGIPT